MLISVTPQLPVLVNAVNPILPTGLAVYIATLVLRHLLVRSGVLASKLIETPEEAVDGGQWRNEKDVSVTAREL
jgi:NCS1 family nucleobase:cation symporter-1